MTFTDYGIGTCSCGVERRLYAPDNAEDARLCYPCALHWSLGEKKQERRVRNFEYLKRQAEYQRKRRAELKAAGMCWTCKTAKATPGMTQCAPCRAGSAEYQRRRNGHEQKVG